MKTVQVRFVGGPLDGTQREEKLPAHWARLRIEKRTAETVHIYCGEIPPNNFGEAVLRYVGSRAEGGTYSNWHQDKRKPRV